MHCGVQEGEGALSSPSGGRGMRSGVVKGAKPGMRPGVQDWPRGSGYRGFRMGEGETGSGEDQVGPVPLTRVTGRSTRRSNALVK